MNTPLVLLPGLVCDAAVWAPQIPHLGRSTLVVDYGAAASIEAMAELALAVAPPGRFALAGHSMGAGTALAVAAAEPELVKGLVLEDPPWWLEEIARRPVNVIRIARSEALVQWIEGLQQRTVADVIDSCRADHPNWDEVEFEHWARSKLRVDLTGVDLPYRELSESVLEQWQQVRCRALLVTGDPAKSGIVTQELAEQFLSLVSGAERSHHAGCGHDIRRDDPAGVAAAITAFLATLDAPAAATT